MRKRDRRGGARRRADFAGRFAHAAHEADAEIARREVLDDPVALASGQASVDERAESLGPGMFVEVQFHRFHLVLDSR